jgi:hypothetical protein
VTALHRRAALLWLCVGLLCVSVAACRAPGEPPTNPGLGEYRDIIRRESDSTHTALASARLVIRTAATAGLPDTYARVTLRSLHGDLENVAIDLKQITPPPAAATAQHRLLVIAERDGALVARLQHHWADAALRQQVLGHVTRDADEIDRKLGDQLLEKG